MRITPLDPPRRFAVGDVTIMHVADVELEPDEQVTFTTSSPSEYDVVRKAWGYYATPSLNRRLPERGLRPALCRNLDGRVALLLCEPQHRTAFDEYLADQSMTVLAWLDGESCPMCRGFDVRPHFTYDAPPAGETIFDLGGDAYQRTVYRCATCGHFISRAAFDVTALYGGDYMDATYAGDRLRATYDRIMALPESQSDNTARVARVVARAGAGGRALDVGSGLGVFPARLREAGWSVVALDPDPRAVEHTAAVAGVEAVCADFFDADVSALGRFDLVTFNKVLEHVEDPVLMLRRAQDLLRPGGLAYVELPDGEAAAEGGPTREEFFIEHLHVFSLPSLVLLAHQAGFRVLESARLREPSTKYTVFAFATPTGRP